MGTTFLSSCVAAVLLLAVACKPNDIIEDIPEPDGTVLLSVHSNEAGVDSLRYVTGQLFNYTRVEGNFAIPTFDKRYMYNDKGMVMKAYDFFANVQGKVDTLAYSNGTVSVAALHEPGTSAIRLNSNGQVQQVQYTGEQYTVAASYTYQDKNLMSYSSVRTENDGTEIKTDIIFTYDDKLNPAYPLSRYNVHLEPVWNSVFFNMGELKDIMHYNAVDSYNNPLSVKMLQTTGGTTTMDVMITYNYTYTSANYPATQDMIASGMEQGMEVSYENVFRYLYLW